MNPSHRKRRVRVITDEVKYARHRRKKLLRRLSRVLFWALVLVVGVAVFWLVLDRVSPSTLAPRAGLTL